MTTPVRRRQFLVRGSLLVMVAVVFATALVVVGTHRPSDYDFYPKCMSFTLLGIHCPGCGLTRSAHSLLNLDVPQAVAWNPFSVFVLPYLGVALLRSVWFWLWDVRSERSLLPSWLGWVIVGLMLVFFVLRNIPVEPFTLLAPHEIGG